MITITTELGGASSVSLLFASVSSSAPSVGFNLPGYAPGLLSGSTGTYRSPVDFISTGERRAYGDRVCKNLQISGGVCIPASASSGTVPWDTDYGIPETQRHLPRFTTGYSFAEMSEAWGASKLVQHVWKCRNQVGSHAFPWFPDTPFYTAPAGSAVSYYGSNDTSWGQLFRAQEIVLSYRLLDTSPGAHAVFYTYAIWDRAWDSNGSLVASSGRAYARFYAIGPSVAGAKDCYEYWPDARGVWTRNLAYPALPTFLLSFSRETFDGFLSCPSRLTDWHPVGESSTFSIPAWTPGKFPASSWHGYIKSSLPDYMETVSAVRKSIGEYFYALVPTLTASSEVDDWQDLGDRAADNVLQTSVNHYSNAQQLSKTLSILQTTLRLSKDWKDPKAWANWWLSLRYGDRLTLKDLSTDVNAIVRSIREQTTGWKKDYYTSHSQSHTIGIGIPGRVPNPKIDHYLKMYYTFQDYGWWGKAYVFGRQWALWPTTAAGWDVIPFSFVVDWFADVQSLFEEFDRDTLLQYVAIPSVILTEKKTYDFGNIACGGFVLSGAKVTYYSRNLDTHLPSGPFRVDRGHSTAINVVDGISLVIQVI